MLDASVAAEAVGPFVYPAQAAAFLAAYAAEDSDLEVWAPDLVYPETLSVLRRHALSATLDPEDGARAIERLRTLPLQVVSTAGLLADAWEMRSAITAYDACYVALARRIDGPLLTADERLARTVTQEEIVRVIMLKELPALD